MLFIKDEIKKWVATSYHRQPERSYSVLSLDISPNNVKGPSIYDVGKFSRFLTPTPLRRQFFTAVRRQFWPIFAPSPP